MVVKVTPLPPFFVLGVSILKKQSVIQTNKLPEVRSIKLVLLSAGFAVLALAIGALCLGRYYVSPVQVARILCSLLFPLEQTWTQPMYDVVINLRLPRVLAAILVGGALSLAGATYQGMFQKYACTDGSKKRFICLCRQASYL